jgi:hypothetical protein
VGFFVDRPRYTPPEPAWQPQQIPEWSGAPRGWLPGYAPERAVVFRTDDLILIAGRFDVYPTGAEFTWQLEMRVPEDGRTCGPSMPFEPRGWPLERDEDLPDDLLRLGVIFADGSSWSNLDGPTFFKPIDEPPTGPISHIHGGGGGGGGWVMNAWLWPLPPDGPLTFVAEWPKYGIPESRADVDGGRVRAAAAYAEQLWSDDASSPQR